MVVTLLFGSGCALYIVAVFFVQHVVSNPDNSFPIDCLCLSIGSGERMLEYET